ncbi:unnamed protein product [Protopolystoma xenopodis]|uniref:Uncharacterized protein n=1 Tax=Protopolystoma xenopodis TaxID=117903 RepID=A0A448WQ12_9PLAT|nr:unnamed protein product [Protopolystoma xenopodis]
MTDKRLAPFHLNRRRLPRQQRQHESSSWSRGIRRPLPVEPTFESPHATLSLEMESSNIWPDQRSLCVSTGTPSSKAISSFGNTEATEWADSPAGLEGDGPTSQAGALTSGRPDDADLSRRLSSTGRLGRRDRRARRSRPKASARAGFAARARGRATASTPERATRVGREQKVHSRGPARPGPPGSAEGNRASPNAPRHPHHHCTAPCRDARAPLRCTCPAAPIDPRLTGLCAVRHSLSLSLSLSQRQPIGLAPSHSTEGAHLRSLFASLAHFARMPLLVFISPACPLSHATPTPHPSTPLASSQALSFRRVTRRKNRSRGPFASLTGCHKAKRGTDRLLCIPAYFVLPLELAILQFPRPTHTHTHTVTQE